MFLGCAHDTAATLQRPPANAVRTASHPQPVPRPSACNSTALCYQHYKHSCTGISYEYHILFSLKSGFRNQYFLNYCYYLVLKIV